MKRKEIKLYQLPAKVLQTPDRYLSPGDEIYVQCKTLSVTFFHSGIYAGNSRAYHFTTDLLDSATASLSDAIAGPGTINLDPWIEYVYSNLSYEPSDNIIPVIYKVHYPYQMRSGGEILRKAEKLRHSSIKFMYDIRRNNCQHFTSFCSIGKPFSYDMANNFKNFVCAILEYSLSSRKYRDSDATRYFGYTQI
uniref:LRAT domain-containing protein n=1 Tax=Panagrolaimus superbus TaxID=310955 RepID=A0A914YBG7_9BILA